MSDMVELAKVLSSFPDLLKEIYTDLAKPGVSQAGKALGGVIGLGNTLLFPIHLINGRSQIYLERNLEQYREQTQYILEENVVEVPPEIGVPVLEKLTYVSNEELSQMYINLLAKASSSQTASQAHPGFVKIIDSLSPDEAIFLKVLHGKRAIPFIEVRLKKKDKHEWTTLADFVVLSSFLDGLVYPENIAAYLSNLDSLGIINIRRDIWLTPVENFYDPIWNEGKEMFEKIHQEVNEHIPDRSLTYEKNKADVTPFGELFILACQTKLGN